MAISDVETPVTFFACPYLKCGTCGRRAVGMVGVVQVLNVLGLISIDLPSTGVNWPCYHQAARSSVCDNWTSTTGCQHSMEERAMHSNSFTFEGVRK